MPQEFQTLIDEMDAASSAGSGPAANEPGKGASSVTDDKGVASLQAKNEPDASIKDPDKSTKDAPSDKDVKTPKEEKEKPFHEHPDWQRMMKERNEAVQKQTQLEKTIQEMKASMETITSMQRHREPSAPGRDYDKELADLHAQLNEGDISQTEHATKMVAILRAQNDEKISQENARIMELVSRETKAKELEAAFYRENPDFDGMMLSGKIAEVKRTSPMHDDFSAYWAAKYHDMKTQMDEKIESARKEEREKVTKEIKAGRSAASLDGASVMQPNLEGKKPDISKINVKKHGGINKILAGRLEALRSEKYGGK